MLGGYMPLFGVIRLLVLIIVGLFIGFAMYKAGYDGGTSAVAGVGASAILAVLISYLDHRNGFDASLPPDTP